MDDVEQWAINVNFPEMYQEEQSLERKYEIITGFTSGMSGKELSQDPNAPGNKTGMLINEANVLINEEVDVLRESVEAMIYAIIKMCSIYLPEDDKYLQKFQLTKQDLVLAQDELSLHGVTVANNPDMTKMEADSFLGKALSNPLIAGDQRLVYMYTTDWLESWGRDSEKLRSYPELLEEKIAIQQEALKRVMAAIKTKNEENQFIQQMIGQGFSPQEAQALLKDFRAAEAIDKGAGAEAAAARAVEQAPQEGQEMPVKGGA